MKRIAFAALGLLALSASSSRAELADVNLGGRFLSPTEGYVDAILNNAAFGHDGTGLALGAAPINFSSTVAFAHPIVVTFDTPNYGEVTADFTSIVSVFVSQAGYFYSLTGTIDGQASAPLLSVNLVNPAYGISSFGIHGEFYYTPVVVPPPHIDPPPCTDCDPPPPCLTCNPPPPCLTCDPPPIVGAPEPSTWLMMLMGFAGLGYAAKRRRQVVA